MLDATMPASLDHEKLLIDETRFGHPAHADYYTYGGRSRGSPMLVFIGGAIDQETYEAREKTWPDNIAAHFQEACAALKVDTAGFLYIACPYGNPDRKNSRIEDMTSLLLRGFLKKCKQDPDQIQGLIGNSMGAYYASGLIPRLRHVRRLVTIAGAGMMEALPMDRLTWSVEETLCFSNWDDPLRDQTVRFVDWLVQQGLPAQHDRRAGRHAFGDYEANGSVRDAFLFAARYLNAGVI